MKKINIPKLGKKGNILSDLFGGIGSFFSGLAQSINTFFQLLPKPLKFGIFLVLILFIGNMMQSAFGLFGIFCDSNNNPMSTGFDLFRNAKLSALRPDYDMLDINGSAIKEVSYTSLSDMVTGCSYLVNHGFFEVYGETGQHNVLEPTWFYQGAACAVNCTRGNAYVADPSNNSIIKTLAGYCLNDAYHRNAPQRFMGVLSTDIFFPSRWGCGVGTGCNPPVGMHYDQDYNVYVCDVETPTCKIQSIGKTWDEELLSNGAVLMYPDVSDFKDYRKAIGVTCPEIKPRLTVFGIEIFDFKLWILLSVVVIIFWLIQRVKNQ